MKEAKGKITAAVICALSMLGVLLTGGAWIINGARGKSTATVEQIYRHALYELCDSVSNIEVNLSKLMIMGGDYETSVVLSDVRSQAELAESSLALLPLDVSETAETSRFFNQLADWSTVYSGAVAGGRDVSEFKKQAELLHKTAAYMKDGLSEAVRDGGRITARIGENRAFGGGVKFSLTDKEHNSLEYPELIYDGAFSDAKKYCFEALDKLEHVSAEQAVELTKQRLGLENAECLGLTDGKTEVYQITGTVDGENALASVTLKGGLVIGYNRTKSVRAVTLGDERAADLAVGYARDLGYGELSPVWRSSENGVAFINLAPEENGIIYYTDLVKVKLAMDDGTLLGIEASGYCRCHKNRSETPTLSETTARSLVDKSLVVEKVTLASIPDGEDEVLCYELFGSCASMRYFVYINAYDGTLERVLRVVSDSSGEMVM